MTTFSRDVLEKIAHANRFSLMLQLSSQEVVDFDIDEAVDSTVRQRCERTSNEQDKFK
jgi:hypothetical protein